MDSFWRWRIHSLANSSPWGSTRAPNFQAIRLRLGRVWVHCTIDKWMAMAGGSDEWTSLLEGTGHQNCHRFCVFLGHCRMMNLHSPRLRRLRAPSNSNPHSTHTGNRQGTATTTATGWTTTETTGDRTTDRPTTNSKQHHNLRSGRRAIW